MGLSDYIGQIIVAIVIAIILFLGALGRNNIRRWLFARRVKPKLQEALSVYEKEIIPDYVDAKPEVKIVQRVEEIPNDQPFGYIFVPEGEEELIWNTIVTFLPVSSSLRRIKILFDENLRDSLFDLLSYELGIKLGKENIAVKFRDNALKKYKEDFQAMEKVYEDRKLTLIILQEASLRYRRCNGHITSSDVEEFSTLVRKIAQIDAIVIRIGHLPVSKYMEESSASKRGVVLLARGMNIERAVEVSEKLKENGYTEIPEKELGLPNPETGTWRFEHPKVHEVPFMRIWLQPPETLVIN